MVAIRIHKNCKEVRQLYPNVEDFATPFSVAWFKVKFVPGEDLVTRAACLAAQVPMRLKAEDEMDATAGYKKFLSMCGHMCVLCETDRIKIPRKLWAQALGVDREATVTAFRQKAVGQGYLVEVAPHIYNPNGRGEATLFRFVLERWEYVKNKIESSV